MKVIDCQYHMYRFQVSKIPKKLYKMIDFPLPVEIPRATMIWSRRELGSNAAQLQDTFFGDVASWAPPDTLW